MGSSELSADDLGLGVTRSYTSRPLTPQTGGTGLGPDWFSDQPYVVSGGSGYAVVFSATQSYWFNSNGDGTFSERFGIKETLTENTSLGQADFTMPDGSVDVFNDFSTYTDARAGQFVARYSPSGAVEIVTGLDSAASNQISQIEWFASASAYSANTPYQTESYSFYTTGEDPNNVGQLESIVLQGISDTGLVNTNMVSYAYYGGTDVAYGLAHDLESATESSWDPTLDSGAGGWSSTNLPSDYYRYTGGLLSMALSPQQVANASGLSTVEGMSNTALSPYADVAFTYGGGFQPGDHGHGFRAL